VLVFHGINGLGWEALPDSVLDAYFHYIKQNENNLWITTFKDAGKYMRERMHATINESKTDKSITVHLTQSLDGSIYNKPLTLKTYIPKNWKNVKVEQSNQQQKVQVKNDGGGNYVLYNAMPDGREIKLSGM
jgi:hypothetical protein